MHLSTILVNLTILSGCFCIFLSSSMFLSKMLPAFPSENMIDLLSSMFCIHDLVSVWSVSEIHNHLLLCDRFNCSEVRVDTSLGFFGIALTKIYTSQLESLELVGGWVVGFRVPMNQPVTTSNWNWSHRKDVTHGGRTGRFVWLILTKSIFSPVQFVLIYPTN